MRNILTEKQLKNENKTGDDWGKTTTVVETHAYVLCKTDVESKRPKTVVSHDLENPPQPPTTNSLKFVVKATKSEAGCFEAGTFVKTLCPMWLQRKEKMILFKFEVIWRLGASSNFKQFYFKAEVKQDQILNYLLSS